MQFYLQPGAFGDPDFVFAIRTVGVSLTLIRILALPTSGFDNDSIDSRSLLTLASDAERRASTS